MDPRNTRKEDKQQESTPVSAAPMTLFAPGASIPTYQSKLVLLGDSGVGKSSLVLRFVKNQFFDYQEPTIGAAFLTQSITFPDHVRKFEIWDTAGQERYRSLAPMYHRSAAAAIVVYDIANHESFLNAQSWIDELQQYTNSDTVIALCGNKVDLAESHREVTTDEARAYADDKGLLFFESSAKLNIKVSEIFKTVARALPLTKTPVHKPPQINLPPEPEQGKCCLSF